MKYLVTSFLALSVVDFALAQQDSMVEVFPLAIGNQWTYSYSDYYSAVEDFRYITDVGVVTLRIISRSDDQDSSTWKVEQQTSLTHRYATPTFDTTYQIQRTDSIYLIELFSPSHPIYEIGTSQVFSFPKDYPDSMKVHRYGLVDSSGIDTVSYVDYSYNYYAMFLLAHSKGLTSYHQHPGAFGGWHYTATLTDFSITSVEPNKNERPPAFTIEQNYPNPFNPETRISYIVRKSTHVSLVIYDILGREIKRLVEESLPPGEYSVGWDASDVPSGVYFCRMVAGPAIETKKLLLVK